MTTITRPPLRVGVTMDERFLEHKTGHAHPEHPRRLSEIYRMIERDFKDRLTVIRPEPATLEQVEMVHTPGHVRRILKTAEQYMSSMAPDTQVSAKTYMAAWLAAGACLQGVGMLMGGAVDAFFALVRPPGHHALAGSAGGFCIFNNLAIAARFAMNSHGVKRILVIDWDIHHGNGINDLFYDERSLYYYSTHDTELYPYSGHPTDTGTSHGMGYTMNIPITRDMTDDDMVYLYKKTLLPVLSGYRPELILVAAGFDAHADDPIGKSGFSENLYGRITRLLIDFYDLAGISLPPVLFSLEGGYDPRSLTRSVKSVLNALCGADHHIDPTEHASVDAMAIADEVMKIHARYGIVDA
jgi:acetoin utilization deacetylase AcuC-like enzyme